VALDVRTPEEFRAGHIRGAINVDYRAADFVERISRLNPDVRYVLYCRSGRRSAGALGVLEDAGVDRVDHMTAGILGWRSADLPLVTE
jgi:rhodanese-related sulfurtransferase